MDLWRRRSDLRHAVLVPRRSHIVFLDDEHTFQQRDGAWTDTLSDPLINHFHEQGLSTFLMQRGNLRQAPRTRPSFAANTIINWGQLLAPALRRSGRLVATLPDHDQVLGFLYRNGVYPDGLSQDALRNKAAAVIATACGFEWLLRIVQPSICFIVGYHWGMGHALAWHAVGTAYFRSNCSARVWARGTRLIAGRPFREWILDPSCGLLELDAGGCSGDRSLDHRAQTSLA